MNTQLVFQVLRYNSQTLYNKAARTKRLRQHAQQNQSEINFL